MIEPDTEINDALISRLIGGAYGHAGQVCISVQRILVHQDIYDDVKQKMVAKLKTLKADDPNLSTTLVGPMIKKAEAKRLETWLDKAVKKMQNSGRRQTGRGTVRTDLAGECGSESGNLSG